jgi:poly-gamma-glutamate synthesis protein (capsule biosynthesis protein)
MNINRFLKSLLLIGFLLITVPFFGFNICNAAEKVLALTAPYPTVTDGVTVRQMERFWKGFQNEVPFRTLLMTEETLEDMTELFGLPSGNADIQTLSADELLQTAWDGEGIWAVIPFENIEPRWKVMNIEGVSPFSLNFDPEKYALSAALPTGKVSNYDRDKLTILTLTGTTAMSRNLAYHIETDGLLVPVENIAETLAASDITHISNEASFTPDCPPGNPLRREARFCSDPSYFALLEAVGADVIELTGNHNVDWGFDPFLYSLDMYENAGMKVYGGGLTQKEAQAPIYIVHNGNKIAFLGCNAVGPDGVWATDSHPGAATCDLPKMEETIVRLKEKGWLPIVTFQHLEYTWYDVPPVQSHDFLKIAREAAPVIISGSQAHIPQGMTFIGDTFIHYGLGNLLFDQMSDVERTSFFDRHYFYNGRYLGNQLETIILENYSQPRFLTETERAAFLEMIFGTCTWREVFTEN